MVSFVSLPFIRECVCRHIRYLLGALVHTSPVTGRILFYLATLYSVGTVAPCVCYLLFQVIKVCPYYIGMWDVGGSLTVTVA